MKSFNEALDELLITLDYSSPNTEGFDFFKEDMIRHTLKSLKSHIRVLKTLNLYESTTIESEKLYDMFTILSEPDPIKGMTGSNHQYKFLALVSDYICHSNYKGDKLLETTKVLDNLINYIEDLFCLSKHRSIDNCEREDKKESMIEWIGDCEERSNLPRKLY